MESATSTRARAELARLLRVDGRREPLVGQIAVDVSIDVVEGRRAAGSHLISVELAQQFRTSRTPVREALMLLEHEGLVEFRARRRARVRAFTLADVRDLYAVRVQLMSFLGARVAESATDAELAELHERVGDMARLVEAGDVGEYFWGHVALQRRMTEIARNQFLRSVLDSLGLRTLVMRRASLQEPGRPQASVQDQVRVVDALSARDAEYAAVLLARSTRAALAAIERTLFAAADDEQLER